MAYYKYPERFSRRPETPRMPEAVWTNDPARRREDTSQVV